MFQKPISKCQKLQWLSVFDIKLLVLPIYIYILKYINVLHVSQTIYFSICSRIGAQHIPRSNGKSSEEIKFM